MTNSSHLFADKRVKLKSIKVVIDKEFLLCVLFLAFPHALGIFLLPQNAAVYTGG
jgi:hypothetical protein